MLVDGRDVGALKGRALADHRRSVGFVFQRFNLIASLTVLDNVLAPTIGGGDARAARRRALDPARGRRPRGVRRRHPGRPLRR